MNTTTVERPCQNCGHQEEYIVTHGCVKCTNINAETAPWPIMKRRVAASQGLKKYWTGRPCTNGHLKQRYTSSGVCMGCHSMHANNYNKRMRGTLGGLISVRVSVHPDDAEAIRQTAAILTATRGLTPTPPPHTPVGRGQSQ
jgi:hypothetical protein